MKIRLVIDPDGADEIVITSREMTDDVILLEKEIARLISGGDDISLFDGECEHFVKVRDILFFETSGGKVFAHTKGECFTSKQTLTELEERLPRSFVRASKTTIVNTMKISSMVRSLTGVSDVGFSSCDKKIVLSRMYYHSVRDRIEEMRLKK